MEEIDDDDMPVPSEGELVVRYFEDSTYSTVALCDLTAFHPGLQPYTEYARKYVRPDAS